MNLSDQILFDSEHIWHPYTSMIDPLKVYCVDSADGVYIQLSDGRRIIDGMASWWATIHGYNNPILNRAAERQIAKVAHVMFGGLTHEPAIELARKLIRIAPTGLEKVFYCDSGSVAVEVAVKMAMQYMHAKSSLDKATNKTESEIAVDSTGQKSAKIKETKNCIATIRSGYHGDTWHAMSVCDPVTGMHSIFTGRLPIQYFAPRPKIAFDGEWDDSDFEPMAQLIEQNHESLAAVIIEPIVQGAGGMWFYHPMYLKRLREWCTRYDVLLIADEIATGFGRTGKMFACEWAGITPDIMCLGKAITGGYMSFAAVMATTNVAQIISKGSPSEFMHGPTFMGNPLACAIANASLEMLIEDSPFEKIAHMEQKIRQLLAPARTLNQVADVRVLGTIGVIEMREVVDIQVLQELFVSEGVWLRPFGKLIYIMPPYIMEDTELEKLANAMIKAASMC